MQAGGPIQSLDLEDLKWKNRLVIFLFSEPSGPKIESVVRDVERLEEELHKRDVALFWLFKTGQGFMNDQILAGPLVRDLEDRYFDSSSEMPKAVLVGKDGGIKMRQVVDMDLQEMLDCIDSMPMRQDEARRAQEKKEQ